MSSILEYIENNPQETQRVIGLKYEQLKQLLEKALFTTSSKAGDG